MFPHLLPDSFRDLDRPEFRAVWDIRDGPPELHITLLTDLDAIRSGQIDQPLSTWDTDRSAFRKSFVLEAEPLGPEESANTRNYPRPSSLAEYEAIVNALICKLGDGCPLMPQVVVCFVAFRCSPLAQEPSLTHAQG